MYEYILHFTGIRYEKVRLENIKKSDLINSFNSLENLYTNYKIISSMYGIISHKISTLFCFALLRRLIVRKLLHSLSLKFSTLLLAYGVYNGLVFIYKSHHHCICTTYTNKESLKAIA